jgi:hypothetical protein
LETTLLLDRKWFTDQSTIGELFINGKFECFTLEDTVRQIKIATKTAIPQGRYQIIINFSNRFQKPMPLLVEVPGFEGIRIHAGNTAADTEGCLLVGQNMGQNSVGNSRAAFAALMPKLERACVVGKVWIDIENRDRDRE